MQSKELLDLIHHRQSQRTYTDQPVEKEKLLRCIEAARLAPSANNSQPWKFIIIDDPGLKNAVAELTSTRMIPMNHFTKQAPVHVAVVREKTNLTTAVGRILKDKNYPLIDIGITTAHFCLQATAESLSTCIIGWFDEKKVKELLHIPKALRLELIILVGYPRTNAIRKKKRKEIADILSYNRY
ncbi:MAG TPA: nitroreductase family protein [Bacteroidales bacterium]|nr:nitroreductase family protein [Bacteroidales bacterium]